MKRKIVTLCGSVRFKEEYDRANESFTLAGWVVLSCGVFNHEWLHRPENNAELLKDGLDSLHKDKIAMSDLVYVINKGGYVGKSTASEIAYATKLGIPIEYMDHPGGA